MMKVVCVFVCFGLVTCSLLFGGHTVFKHLKQANDLLDIRVVQARRLVEAAEQHSQQVSALRESLAAVTRRADEVEADLRSAHQLKETLIVEMEAVAVRIREQEAALAAAEESIRLRDAAAEAREAEFKARAAAAVAELSK